MADDTTPPETHAEAAATVAPAESAPEVSSDPTLGDAGQKAIAAERKRASEAEKARRQLEARLKEYEDRDKTEAQRQAEALAEWQQKATQYETELSRERIARRHGITDDYLDLLGSGSEEELEARAIRLANLNAAAAAAAGQATPPARRPVESLKPGAMPVTEAADMGDAYPSEWLPS